MVKKILLKIIEIVIILFLLLFSIIALITIIDYVTERTNPELHGSHDLGDRIYQVDWGKGSIIVKGIGFSGNTCVSGYNIIPSNKCQFDSTGRWNEYILKADTINHWVIAKTQTINPHGTKYYILDKQKLKEINYNIDDSLAYLRCYYDSLSFMRACQELRIDNTRITKITK